MSTTPNFLLQLEELSQGELLQRRSAILDRAKAGIASLEDSDLTELVAILNLLRKRTSAPPSVRNTPRASGAGKTKVTAASDSELLDF